ncbi:MAG: M20/M25/M40 family metallo-hydrolase, partial [Planctomycetota bacterium]|nr:M20/M25/M40 family metallo-hydrolase [Planctomycetota bacterium]
IGASSAAEAREHAAVGDPAVIVAPFARMLNETVVARGFDDRIGAFVVMETLKLLKPRKDRLKVSVHAVSTVQEEVGLRGARTSAFSIDPHVGIAVDVGFATDYPGENKKEFGDVKLGKGPILHRGSNINPVLADLMEKTAAKKKIPFQMQAAPNSTGTDANAIQVSRGGVATALVSIPNRYMHSAIEVVSLRDVSAAARLLAETIMAIEPGMSFVPA